jgi:hypothetical protein
MTNSHKKNLRGRPKHVGPGSAIISIYAPKMLYRDIQRRAESLGMSASKYLMSVAQNDIREGGPLKVYPQTTEKRQK